MSYNKLTIEFNHSSSPRFKFALDEAKKHSSFIQLNKTYQVTFTHKESELSYRMSQFLKGLRNKKVFIDGKELPWDEVFHYCDCYTLRQLAYDPVKYCTGDSRQFPAFNLWRCIQAMMPLSNDTEWLRFGHFDLDETFIFDKKQIKHYLLSNTYKYRFCPALRSDIMLMVLEAFPETVNPRIDKNWKYTEPLNRELKAEITTGKEIKQYAGVAPASPIAIKNIYEKILDKFC